MHREPNSAASDLRDSPTVCDPLPFAVRLVRPWARQSKADGQAENSINQRHGIPRGEYQLTLGAGVEHFISYDRRSSLRGFLYEVDALPVVEHEPIRGFPDRKRRIR